ncbi:MAG TPA: hypothetical protein VL334_09140 [Anaerolineae bacterium]|nr:hypothetical protein [Anaerolineae bacterium]
MESITVPTENPTAGLLAEIKQISVVDDENVGAVNALLTDGWRLVHVGHTSQHTVYVLGRSAHAAKRRTGFVATT